MNQSKDGFFHNVVAPRQETINQVLTSTSSTAYRRIWWKSFRKEMVSIPPGLADRYEASADEVRVRRNWRRGFVIGYNVLAAALILVAPVASGAMITGEAAWFLSNPKRAFHTADAAVEQAVQRRIATTR